MSAPERFLYKDIRPLPCCLVANCGARTIVTYHDPESMTTWYGCTGNPAHKICVEIFEEANDENNN